MEPFLNERLSIDENPTPTLLIKKKTKVEAIAVPRVYDAYGWLHKHLRTQDSGLRRVQPQKHQTLSQQKLFHRITTKYLL